MVSWDIALGLVLLAFAVPFFVLHYKEKRHRLYAQCKYAEASQLRRMLREAEEHIRRDQSLILEALGTPFLLMRPGGRVVMANSKACRLFGVESLDATNLLLSLPESEMREFLSRVVRATEKIRTKLQVPGEQGERGYRVTATPSATRARYIGIVFSDMTEEYRTQVVRRDFVANASHELRTPLTLILGYLETLLDDPAASQDTAMLRHSLGIMKRHADRMTRLVSDMSMLSRIETPDSAYLKQEEFDLVQLVTEVQERLQPMVEAQQARVQIDIAPEPFLMHGDCFYWSQVLFNLVENALKNNPTPGLRVLVKAFVEADASLCICVEDNGVGIAADSLPFIFNRFYRADSGGKIKGTGLGLAIVKHAVEAHGGTIRAESRPGFRTAFTITLPPPN
ncbi:MAG: PAS domain-containing protein [Akkermansiaceae bacterium]|nr:PAS domain-containing protein [Akkermansiaceae bacterium]